MKIGIITQPLLTNYGGLLQNYALQQALRQLGHESVTLDQGYNPAPFWIIAKAFIKTFILKLIGRGKNRKYPFRVDEKQIKYVRQHTNYFINKYIVHTEPFLYENEFKEYTIKHQLDALIVGSDQVWRPMYNQNILRSFFDFAKGLQVRRLAYAASFGVDYWEFTQDQTKKCQELICDFTAVSVREYSGINLCRKYLFTDAVHVLDPTMLLDREDYMRLVDNEKEPASKGDLFTYILDETEEKNNCINKVALELNLTQFTSMAKDDKSICPSVTQWLRSFMDAKFVVCDSFHGAVFSIIFNKPFVIIGNKERGMTRFNSLLDTFDLRNRLVVNSNDICSIIYTPIDWKKVNRIRAELKMLSLDFVKSNLK